MITYQRHPIDSNINYLGIDCNQNIIFDGYIVDNSVSWVDVYSSKGKWRGKQVARFNAIMYKRK
jgi:hypothetical protein